MRRPYVPQLVAARPTAAPGHFVIDRPLDTHWRDATCKEVNCKHYLEGWLMVLPDPSPQLDYLRQSERHFTEEKKGGGTIELSFPPGQKCVRGPHKMLLNKLENFVGNGRQHANPNDWTEHHNETLYQFQRVKERG